MGPGVARVAFSLALQASDGPTVPGAAASLRVTDSGWHWAGPPGLAPPAVLPAGGRLARRAAVPQGLTQ